MRLHSKFKNDKTQLIYELIWFSDFNKLVMIVNKTSPTSIPLMLGFDSFFSEYSPKDDQQRTESSEYAQAVFVINCRWQDETRGCSVARNSRQSVEETSKQ